MKPFLVLLLAIILISCHHDAAIKPDVKTQLAGSWDAYYGEYPDGPFEGLQYAILMNYENGFVLKDDGKYLSRNAKGTRFEDGFATTPNSGSWMLKSDTITFTHTAQDVTDMLHFRIVQLEKDKLVIEAIGRGSDMQQVMFRRIHLKRSI
jgi:hypothetical protein